MSETFSQDQLTRSYADAAALDARAAELLGGAESAATDATSADVCGVWRRIRPIIEGASNLFFIPPNIRAALKLLIGVLDGICPQ
ncbi:MAG TPA: hypothetical protein VGB66_19695 [Longimicrobium sp.]|jgi:hypothetical protein